MSLWRMIATAVNLAGVRFGGAAIGLLSQLMLARLMPQDEVGIVFLSMSAGIVISLILTAGYAPLALVSLPRYHALGRNTLIRSFQSSFWREAGLVTLLLAALLAAALFLLPFDEGLRIALLFGFVTAIPMALLRFNGSAANAVRRYNVAYVPDFIIRPGVFLLAILLAWSMGWSLTVPGVLWTFLLISIAGAIGQSWAMGEHSPWPALRHKPRTAHLQKLRARAGALIIVAAVTASFGDIVNLLGGFLMPPDDVAVLSICVRLAALIGFITQATQSFILPDLAEALSKRGDIRSILFRTNVVTLGAILGCLAAAVIGGGLVLGLFGPAYVAGHWPLVLFLLAQGLRAASGMNQYLLSLDGHQAKTAGSCLLSVATLVIAAVLLTPEFGLMGMALAVILSDLQWALMLAFQAKQHTGRRGDILAVLPGAR